MKKLTLIRHAKSSHSAVLSLDFDRPLSPRGERDAPLIGRRLKQAHDFAPDALLTSPALRALTTARIIRQEAGLMHLPLEEETLIYEAPLRSLISVLRNLPGHCRQPVLFGHNPGLELLADYLCGQSVVHGLRTGGVVMLSLPDQPWSQLEAGSATLLTYFHPAQIGGGKDAHGE